MTTGLSREVAGLLRLVALAGLLTSGPAGGFADTYWPHLLAPTEPGQWFVMRRSFPVTVAGLFRTLTGFPILPPASGRQPPVTIERVVPHPAGRVNLEIRTAGAPVRDIGPPLSAPDRNSHHRPTR